MERIEVKTVKRIEFIDITGKVKDIVRKSGVTNGIAIVYTPHTTAAITINENADPSVKYDINEFLSKLIPYKGNYTHFEGNSDAHIKSSVIGCSEHLIIENKDIVLGTWQGIFFCEFDGPRRRNVFVQVIEK
jgi:secondary thiamine-phosphate synthase enzyme